MCMQSVVYEYMHSVVYAQIMLSRVCDVVWAIVILSVAGSDAVYLATVSYASTVLRGEMLCTIKKRFNLIFMNIVILSN